MTATRKVPRTTHPVTQVLDCPGIQLIRYERGFTEQEQVAFLEESSRNIAQVAPDVRHVLILDVNAAEAGTSLQRQRQAQWQEQHERYFRRHVVAGIFVARSPIVRGAIRAVGWFKPFPYETHQVDDVETAIAKAVELLVAAKLPRPSERELDRLRAIYR
ncbi:MAG: hypothetical protein OHK0013_04930 [Sandaracinaceae bacterium]